MKILSMTATFGKLANDTLVLQPGMNVIRADNESGKSTWCAFVAAMLYGIDTRERSKQNMLADKERYQPWSGAPMAGRMDLLWNGRKITIERRSKGRGVFNDFSAYETDTGSRVAELTADNCGQVLLGVEKPVFTRTAFIRLTDMPVEQHEALRARLNALVTTGDESGTSTALGAKLKELKNRCRFNRSGLLPQLELQRDELQNKLSQMQTLQQQLSALRQQQTQLSQQLQDLENHKVALAYQANARQGEKLEAAKIACQTALQKLQEMELGCSQLPTAEEAMTALTEIRQLRDSWDTLAMEMQLLPSPAQAPDTPYPFVGLKGADAVRYAQTDEKVYQEACRESKPGMKQYLPLLLLPAGILLFFVPHWIGLAFGVVALLSAVGLFAMVYSGAKRAAETVVTLNAKYAPLPPEQWVAAAKSYAKVQQEYANDQAALQEKRQQMENRRAQLKMQIDKATKGTSFSAAEEKWRAVARQWEALHQQREECRRAEDLVQAMDGVREQLQLPQHPDTLTLSQQETQLRLQQLTLQQSRLQENVGSCSGQILSLGNEETLQRQLSQVQQRITALEETYDAIVLAQQTLTAAENALQRRFAPRISKRTQELFSCLTGNRYDRLQLKEDLSLSVGAVGETTLHDSLWRSDGTVDQLYLALRLSVAEELAPQAPLVLDDALVRFDDTRLAAAMALLEEMAQQRQVLLFSCQSREEAIWNK